MQAAQDWEGDDLATCRMWRHGSSFLLRNLLLDALMRSCLVEVRHIGFHDQLELLLMQDEKVIETLSPHTPQKPFTDGIGTRCSVFRHHHPSFLHLGTKQPTHIPEHDLSARGTGTPPLGGG